MAGKQSVAVSVGLAVIGILGTLLGGTVQHFLSVHRAQTEAFEERRRAAYVAFLVALDKDRIARDDEAEGRTESAKKLKREFELEGGAAIRQIAIYGDSGVIEAIAAYARLVRPPDNRCVGTWETDVAIYERMRDSSLGDSQKVDRNDLAELALLCSPPS